MEPDDRPDLPEKEVLAPGQASQPLGDAGALEHVIRAQKGPVVSAVFVCRIKDIRGSW